MTDDKRGISEDRVFTAGVEYNRIRQQFCQTVPDLTKVT